MKETTHALVNDVELAETAGTPRQSAGLTTRHAPPASEGLVAGADKAEHVDVRRRRNYPAKRSGPLSLATTEALMQAVMEMTPDDTPQGIAIRHGMATDGKTVREVIKTAREAFAKRAADYVEAHYQAVELAIADGDPKALAVATAAAQWAIEKISEGNTRVIDPPKSGPAAPGLRIGIAVGGVPQPQQPTVNIREELPPAPFTEVDTP